MTHCLSGELFSFVFVSKSVNVNPGSSLIVHDTLVSQLMTEGFFEILRFDAF